MATLHDQINLAAMLALMVTKTGNLVGRLRVQKLMYLLQQKGAMPLSPFFFEYHHYGPYSAEVADVLKGAVRSRIVREFEHSDDDGWKRFEYRPDEQAARYIDRVDAQTQALVDEVLRVSADSHWRTLELAATADFLRRSDNLDLDTAFREALERKPACRLYHRQARQLLDDLNL